MSMTQISSSSPVCARRWFAGGSLSSLVALMALLLSLCAARAEGPDDEYLRIYGLIDQGDSLTASGNATGAREKYLEAQKALNDFKLNYPTWNGAVVSYRLNYLAQKLAPPPVKPSENVGASASGTRPAFQPPAVKLLEAGAEPRKVLRLHPKAGDTQSAQTTIKMSVELGAEAMPIPAMNMPPLRMAMDVKVDSVSPEGDVSYGLTFGDGSVVEDDKDSPPEVAEAFKKELESLKGATGTGVFTDRGVSKSSSFTPPPGMKGKARQTLEQMKDALTQITLPEEAVGIGAKWEVTQRVRSQGLTVEQTETHELTSMDGDVITVKTVATQTASGQKMQGGAAPGMKMDLDKMTGKATGTTTVNLTKAVPTAGTTTAHTEMEMSMAAGGQKQSMTMKMDMSSSVESK
jgi:hypothetical protein